MRTISQEDATWAQAQLVRGTPDLTRLRDALEEDGSQVAEFVLSKDHEFISFHMARGEAVRGRDKE
jgi:hypothetical protein